MTKNRIWRAYFEDSRLVVLEVPGTNGQDERPGFLRLGTTAAKRHCRGPAKSWSTDGLDKGLIEEHTIPWSSESNEKTYTGPTGVRLTVGKCWLHPPRTDTWLVEKIEDSTTVRSNG